MPPWVNCAGVFLQASFGVPRSGTVSLVPSFAVACWTADHYRFKNLTGVSIDSYRRCFTVNFAFS
jgi:hypothetical protein